MDLDTLIAQWSGKLPPGFVPHAVPREEPPPRCSMKRCYKPAAIKKDGTYAHACASCLARRGRSTRRKGTERHVAVAREGGRILNGHCAAARGKPRGPDDSVGRAEGDRPWREVSCVTAERSDIVSRCGATYGGRRAEWLAGLVSFGTRRGRRMRRQGNTRQGLMPQLVAGSERPAMAGNGSPITT